MLGALNPTTPQPNPAEPQDEFLVAVPMDDDALFEAQLQAERQAAEDEAKRRAALTTLGNRVLMELNQRKAARSEIEQRWHRDVRRYAGQYEARVLEAIKSRGFGSDAFVPLTSRVCNIVEARLTDMLFPTDERNFAITETPAPELAEVQALAAALPQDREVQPGVQAGQLTVIAKEIRAQHRSAADAMQREVDDQLRESNYASVGRAVIRDAIIMGMGVIKGPTLQLRTRKVWAQVPSTQLWAMNIAQDTSPGVVRVDPWNFYPDTSCPDVRDGAPIEAHYLRAKELRDYASLPGFFPDAIREVLKVKPGRVLDDNKEQLKALSGMSGATHNAYLIAEYQGAIELDEAEALGFDCPKLPDGSPDPLYGYSATVFVAEDGSVIGALPSDLPSQEHEYSVFNWRVDPGSPFGFGLAYDIADLQDLGNSTFRAAVDNMGLSVGPQIVVGKGVRPVNGQWVIEPNKLWEQDDDSIPVKDAFGFFQIDSRVGELMELFTTIRDLVDDVSGTQLAMAGQDAPSFMETARGASMAYNAANIWMRRAVRLWDDQITSRLIQRFVDWNMANSPKQEIKGDLHATARGTSALLEAEVQAQKLASFIELSKDLPQPLKQRIEQLRSYARAMRLDPTGLLPADDEIPELERKLAQQQPPPNPELERIRIRELDLKDRAEERQFQAELEAQRSQLRMAELASRENLSVEQIRAKYGIDETKMLAHLQDRREQRAHDAQKFNAELVVKQRMGTGV